MLEVCKTYRDSVTKYTVSKIDVGDTRTWIGTQKKEKVLQLKRLDQDWELYCDYSN